MRKRQLFSNLGIKLSSLALALALWFSVSGGKEGFSFIRGGEIKIEVPVRVLELPFSTFQVKVEPDTVELLLTGSRGVLKRLAPRDILVFVPVEGLKKGEYSLPFRAYLPDGIKISKRRPDVVKVILDDRWMMKESFPESLFKKGE